MSHKLHIVFAAASIAAAAALASCAAEPIEKPAAKPPQIRVITVNDQHVGDIYRFWSVANFNAPHRLLTPEGVQSVKGNTPFVREINCVYMLGGRWEGENRWFLGVNDDGSLKTDFRGMITELKSILDAGYKPRIVLDDVPPEMSASPTKNAYGNTEPPADERLWHRYVHAAITAMVQAFGRDQVATWPFRVGTEPDLYPGHWTGTKEQYLAHYDFTVDAVRQVIPNARIGPGNILNPGPLIAGGEGKRPKWGLDIIDHAGAGTNACTNSKGTPVDVFSSSYYVRVGKPTDAFDRSILAMRSRLDQYPQFKNVQIECGEFAVLWDERGRRLWAGESTEWSASFYAALADRVYRLDVRQLYEWNHMSHGVMHPRGRVIEMLEKMIGGRRLAVHVQAPTPAECGAIACQQPDALYVLVYHHQAPKKSTTPEKARLVLQDDRMKPGAEWKIQEWTIDREKASWAYAYQADCAVAGIKQQKDAGDYEASPSKLYGPEGAALFNKNQSKYAKLSEVPLTRDEPIRVDAGRVQLDLEMSPHSVRLLKLSPAIH